MTFTRRHTRDALRWALVLAALCAVAVIAFASGSRQALAVPTTFEVTTTNDEPLTNRADTTCVSASGCSLRAALQAADNRGVDATTINLPAGIYSLDPARGALLVGAVPGEVVNITGAGAGVAIVRQAPGCIETATLNCMVFFLDPNGSGGVSISMSGITITGGHTSNVGGGGGILGGSLTNTPDTTAIANCTITGNITLGGTPGGGIAYAHGSLTVTNSTFSGNHAGGGDGGAIDFADTIGGSTLVVSGSTFTGNTTTAGLDGGGGAIHTLGDGSSYTIGGAIFTGNTANDAGGSGGGGAIFNDSGTLTVTSSTFTGNSAGGSGAGGAIYNSSDGANLSLNRFAGNTAAAGRGQSVSRNTGNPGVVTAENNWWGTNSPDSSDAAANVTLTDWIVLELTASPAFLSHGGSAVLTADLSHNNVGASPGLIPLSPAIPVTWPPATLGTLSGQSAFLDGHGQATATYTADGTSGTGMASVQVDGQTVALNIPILLPPTISKAFGAASVPLHGTTTLTFNLTNPNTESALTGVGFTDNLPVGLAVATPNGLTGSCGAGTITAAAGGGAVSLDGGTLAAGGSCTFSVNVMGASAGTQQNSTSAVTSTEGGRGGSAAATIDVVAPPTISKTFVPSSIPVNGTTTIFFVITNPAGNAVPLTGVGFTDTLPFGLTVATNKVSICGGTLTLTPPNTISLVGAIVAPNSTCILAAVVTGTASGSYTNVTGPVTSTNGGTGNTATDILVVANPPEISKSFGATSLAFGDSTTLTFTIHNPNAQIVLTGVGFTDSLPAGLVVANPNGLTGSCGGGAITAVAGDSSVSLSGASLAAGDSCTFSVNVTGTSSGLKVNSVSATSTEGGTGDTSSASITVLGRADVAVSKTGPAEAVAGDPANLTYVITVVNNGPSDAEVVVLTDSVPAGETIVSQVQTSGPAFGQGGSPFLIKDTIAVLPSGASATFAVVVQVSPSLPDGTVLANTAEVSSSTADPDQGNNVSTASTLVHAHADLAVTKTGPAEAVAGDPANVTYTVTITNNGVSDAQGATLVDALPAGQTFVSQGQTSGPAFTLSASGNTIEDSIGTLAAGASASFTIVAHVSPSVLEGTVFANTATVGSRTTDPNPTNNSSTASTLVHAHADLAVTKIGPAEATAGDPANLTYTITVVNNGFSDAQAVVLSDALPAGETFVTQSQTSGPAFALGAAGNTVTDGAATLAAGASASFTIVAHVSPAVPEGTVFSNTVTVASSTTDPNPTNNSSTASTLVHAGADLVVFKTGPAEAIAGDPANVTYTLTVVNNGPGDAQSVALTDPLPVGEVLVSQAQTSGPPFAIVSSFNTVSDTVATLPAGASASFTVVVHISPSVLEGTVLSNTATVASFTADPNPGNNSSTASTLVHARADLAVSKSGPAETIAGDPANLTYTITVVNNGFSDAQGVVLSDALPVGELLVSQSQTSGPGFALGSSGNTVSDTIATLPAGASASFTVVAHVSPSVVEGTVFSNTATVASSTTDSDPTNNSSTASTLVHAHADLAVTKTGPAEAVAGDPANLIYTVTIANNGPSDAQAVVLTDALPPGETLVSQAQTSGPAFGLTMSGNTITDGVATLPAGASASFTVIAHVSASLHEGTVLSNTTTAGSSTTDPDPVNNSSTASTLVHARADLVVTKSGPATAVAGDPANLTYTITIGNAGPSDAQAVVLSDALPPGETLVSQVQTSGPAFALASGGSTISDTIGTLAAGASATFTVTAHVASTVPEGMVLVNAAVVGSATTDPNPTNNVSTVSTLITDARISAGGVDVAGVEGQAFTSQVAKFCDLDPASTAGEYSATIDWGDATTSAGTVVSSGGGSCGNTFSVVGTHLYAEEGIYHVTVTIADPDTPANSATVASTARVADAQLTSICAAPTGAVGAAFAGSVATFTDASSTGTPSDFAATIDWGDGTTSAGIVTGGPGTAAYTVSGTHTYTKFGPRAIKTTITDVGGQTTVASCAPIFVFPPSTNPPCHLDAVGSVQAMNGDPAAFFVDITPPVPGQTLAPSENAVVFVDFGPADQFVFRSTQILAVTCTDSTSATIYGAATVSSGTSTSSVFFILDLTARNQVQPPTLRLQLFGAHPYDSGTQRVFGAVLINKSEET